MFDEKQLHRIEEKLDYLKTQGEQILIVLSKLKAEDAILAADVTALTPAIQTAGANIQNSINAFAALDIDDPTLQAAVDNFVANLTTVASNIAAATASVVGLPTAPSPAPATPAPPAA